MSMKTALELITEERQRQIEQHGWTPEHDDTHAAGQLAHAAAGYAHHAGFQSGDMEDPEDMVVYDTAGKIPPRWPFSFSWWKPSRDRKRNLAKAGALILAELERVIREEAA